MDKSANERNIRRAILTLVSSELGDATFDLSCPIVGEHEVIVETHENIEEGEFGRADPDWAGTEVHLKYSQGALHIHADLSEDEGLYVTIKDAEHVYEASVTIAKWEERQVIAQNIEVEYIPYSEEEEETT